MRNIAQLTLALLAASTLVACGGGSSGTATVPTYPTTAKYLGTWNSICDTDDIEANGAAGSYVVTSLEFTSNTATAVSGNLKTKVYGFTDSSCTTLLATMAQALTVTIDSVGTGPNGSDKVTGVVQNAAISGATVTITSGANSIKYLNGRTLGSTGKDILLASATKIQTSGLGSGITAAATTYPTTLDNSVYGFFTKQ